MRLPSYRHEELTGDLTIKITKPVTFEVTFTASRGPGATPRPVSRRRDRGHAPTSPDLNAARCGVSEKVKIVSTYSSRLNLRRPSRIVRGRRPAQAGGGLQREIASGHLRIGAPDAEQRLHHDPVLSIQPCPAVATIWEYLEIWRRNGNRCECRHGGEDVEVRPAG